MPAEVQAGRGGSSGHGGGGGGHGGSGGGGRGGHGGGDRGGYGGGNRGGYEGGRGYGGNHGGYGGYGYGGIGLGVGLGYGGYGYGYPYSNYGGTFGGTSYVPSYSYVQPLVYTTPNYYNMRSNVAANPNVAVQQSAYYSPAELTTASVDVRVPADAKVWFDGTPTTMTGADRVFASPPLESGKAYQYEVRAQWMQDGKPVEKTMSIQVGAGQRSLANFVTR